MAQFDCIGNLEQIRESDTFKAYTEHTSESGWTSKRFRYNVVSDTNRTLMTSEALYKEDMSNDIMLFTRATFEGNKRVKDGERVSVPFKKRLEEDTSKYPTSRLFVIDTNTKADRTNSRTIRRKLNNGSEITEEDLEKFGVDTVDTAKKKLEDMDKKYHVYISEYDFLNEVKENIESGAWSGKVFRVRGNYNYQYSKQNDRFYDSAKPNRIELVDVDDKPKAEATIDLYYTADSLDDSSYDEDKKILINGWDRYYESNRDFKRNLFKPTTIVFKNGNDAKAEKRCEVFKKKFSVDDSDKVMKRTIVVNMVNGSERVEITEDMFSPEQLDDIDLGLKTKEEVIAELGGTAYGNFVNEWQFASFKGDPEDSGFKKFEDIDTQFGTEDEGDDDDLFN